MYPEAFVYFCREGQNQELRYSMRSVAAAFPGVPVFMVGDMPQWCQPDGFLQGNLKGSKPANVYDNVRLIAEWDALPQQVIIMNDDMFITAPVTDIPLLHRGYLIEHLGPLMIRDDWWSHSLESCVELLGTRALSYELHTPFPVVRDILAHALALPEDWDELEQEYPQWRTMYGNRAGLPSEQAERDVKMVKRHSREIPEPFMSTDDLSFRDNYHRLLSSMFQERSPWERDFR